MSLEERRVKTSLRLSGLPSGQTLGDETFLDYVLGLFEETGIAPREIRYHSSQPWPFPSSLMLGFTARATATRPVLHDGELEDARWFRREELQAGTVALPPPESISRRLIDTWLGHAAS